MKMHRFALSALLMVAIGVVGCRPSSEQSSQERAAVAHPSAIVLGAPLPDFELTTYDGEAHRLSEYLDGEHYVAVIFHSPACPCARNCAEAIVKEITPEAYPDLKILGVLPEANWDVDWMRADMEGQQRVGIVTFPVVIDRDQALMTKWGVERVPTVFLADKEGRLRYWGAPESTLDTGMDGYNFLLKDALDALRAGNEPEVTHFPTIGCLIAKATP